MENLNELKPEDVMRALECHIKRRCYDCPLGKEEIEDLSKPCSTMIAELSLALLREKHSLIEVLAKNNADLEAELAETHDLCEEKDAEIESYRKIVGDLVVRDGEVVGIIDGKETRYIDKSVSNVLKTMAVNRVKADTVRKMHSEIKERCIKGGIYPAFVASTIDKIAKEMLEANE